MIVSNEVVGFKLNSNYINIIRKDRIEAIILIHLSMKHQHY